MLIKLLFDKEELFDLISEAKKERIDKQYYVTTEKDDLTKEIAGVLLKYAEDFVLKMKTMIRSLSNDDIKEVREKFKAI